MHDKSIQKFHLKEPEILFTEKLVQKDVDGIPPLCYTEKKLFKFWERALFAESYFIFGINFGPTSRFACISWIVLKI